jgi:hypothetical protein
MSIQPGNCLLLQPVGSRKTCRSLLLLVRIIVYFISAHGCFLSHCETAAMMDRIGERKQVSVAAIQLWKYTVQFGSVRGLAPLAGKVS